MLSSNGNFPLSTELVVHIFCHLSQFSDVLALAATCSRLRAIWFANVTPIYKQVAPRSIPCEQHARRFLADQGGSALETQLSPRDVIRMARNADVVEKAVEQFEREIVRRVRSKLQHRLQRVCGKHDSDTGLEKPTASQSGS